MGAYPALSQAPKSLVQGTCGPEIVRSFCFPGRVLFLREIKRQDYILV